MGQITVPLCKNNKTVVNCNCLVVGQDSLFLNLSPSFLWLTSRSYTFHFTSTDFYPIIFVLSWSNHFCCITVTTSSIPNPSLNSCNPICYLTPHIHLIILISASEVPTHFFQRPGFTTIQLTYTNIHYAYSFCITFLSQKQRCPYLVWGTSCLNLFHPSVLWHCWLGGRKGIWPVEKWGDGGGGHWLVQMEWRPAARSVSASVNLPLHHKVQFSSGTGSPGWSRKKGRKTVVVWCGCALASTAESVSQHLYLCSAHHPHNRIIH